MLQSAKYVIDILYVMQKVRQNKTSLRLHLNAHKALNYIIIIN